MGQISGKEPSKPRRNTVAPATLTAKRKKNGHLRSLCSYFVRHDRTPVATLDRRESASFCYTWVIPVHFPLTTNCA